VLIDAALLYRWTMDMCVSCVKTSRTVNAADSNHDESKDPSAHMTVDLKSCYPLRDHGTAIVELPRGRSVSSQRQVIFCGCIWRRLQYDQCFVSVAEYMCDVHPSSPPTLSSLCFRTAHIELPFPHLLVLPLCKADFADQHYFE